nr:unnamed protein product [Digitaria exilis]
MKKCLSELELEAFIHGPAGAAAAAAAGNKPEHDIAAQVPFGAGVFPPADLSAFSFADSFAFVLSEQNTLNGSIPNHLWSHNHNVRHPAVSTIESQSSICGIYWRTCMAFLPHFQSLH